MKIVFLGDVKILVSAHRTKNLSINSTRWTHLCDTCVNFNRTEMNFLPGRSVEELRVCFKHKALDTVRNVIFSIGCKYRYRRIRRGCTTYSFKPKRQIYSRLQIESRTVLDVAVRLLCSRLINR